VTYGFDEPASGAGDRAAGDGTIGDDTAGADALEHFWGAAHEFLQAMRALIDAADAYVEEQRRPRETGQPRVRRIDIE
jgi:hypothetical protein